MRNLVFQGGGVKGIAYVGALKVLEERGIRPQIEAVAGTSAGAITAALVAVGYTADELGQTMLAMDLQQFEDGRLDGAVRLIEHYGWFKGDDFLKWMQHQVAAKMGSPAATFADVHRERNIDLRVVATNLSTHSAQIFSSALTPQVAVADAVRMSMSIPFFFAAVDVDGQVHVDGGAVWNYPIEIFDGDQPDPGTLGLHLDHKSAPPPPVQIHDLVGFAKSLYEAVLRVQDDFFSRDLDDQRRTVSIDDLGIRATDFGLSQATKQQLIDNGRVAMTAYLGG